MVRRISVPVRCVDCGKCLRGSATLSGRGYHVLRHKTPQGRPCLGHLIVRHQPVAAKQPPAKALAARDGER